MEKKTLKKILTICFVSVLVLPTFVWGAALGICKISGSSTDGLIFDTGENRNKNQFPDSFDIDDYTSKINDWYDDNMPFRDSLYTAYKSLNNSFESTYINHIKPFLDAIANPLTASDLLEQYNQGYEDGYNVATSDNAVSQDDEGGYSKGYADGYSEGIGDIANCSHAFSKTWIEKEPSCSEEGTMFGDCSKCGKTIQIAISKTPHDNVLLKKTEASCLKDGVTTYRCSKCGEESSVVTEGGHHGDFIRQVKASYEDYGYDLYQCSSCGTYYRMNTMAKPIDSSFKSPAIVGEVLLGRNKWLFYTGDNSIRIYTGELRFDEFFDFYASVMGRFLDYCKKNGKKITFEIIPNREKLYSEYMPSYTRIGDDDMKKAVSYIKEKYGYDLHYQLDELCAYKPYYQIAYKYDTHWNMAGGFIGAQNIYKHLGLNTADIRREKITVLENQTGGLPPMGGLNVDDYSDDIDYNIFYPGYAKIFDDSLKEKKLAYIGDSFRAAALPVFRQDFANVYSLHYGSDSFQEMANAIKDSDYIVMSAVERYNYTLFYSIEYILSYLGA